jgi:type VI secretion system secreted protein VgrG
MPIARLLEINSPLGADALVVTRLHAHETLGMPYSIEVDVLASDGAILPSALLTKEVTVTVTQSGDDSEMKRHFHGLVAEFMALGPGPGGRAAYRLVAVPGVWRLGLKRNCRIFQAKSAKDIVDAIMGEHGLPAASWGILPTLEALPYCTQFNETDLHFVSRLLEEHGMSYYFSHTASAHTLHISATAPGFPAFEGGDVVAKASTASSLELGQWQRADRARSGSILLEDMDGERSQPSVVQTKTSDTRTYDGEPAMWAAGKVYRWPGGMATRPGLDPAAVEMGAQESASEHYSAAAVDPRYGAGARVSIGLLAEDGSEARKSYVVTTADHVASDSSAVGAGSAGAESYRCSLTLVAAARTWMPSRQHHRPLMTGVYSAKVTGPSGEKIHVDEFGRIKVKFRWDHLGANDDTTSCWVRVAQAAAGSWGGTWFLPRIGDEVLVAFLDGDPDRPIVTGSVYGKDAKPPFLPGTNPAQSGISTRSHKSDSADDANVLRFEDKKDSEEVFLHAQKDLNVEVEHDETRKIDHDQTETIKNARTVTVKESHDTLTVEQGNREATIKQGNDTLTVETGNRQAVIKTGDDTTSVDTGNREATIKTGNETVTVNTGNATHTIKMGNMTIKCSMGSITLEAMQSITLKVGGSTLVVDQSGVTIKGTMISEEAQALLKLKAPLVQVDADGLVMVKGGLVMLN